MSQWKKVKIGDFLHQYRNTMYVEDTETYRQITISSKDGIKYRCSKIGKEIGRKRQFKIDLKQNPNTVIFTRQGLHEGSIGIAPLEVDGCIATENMPMFSLDETIVLSDYLKYFFKSPVFINLIGTLTPTGSAQKAIHERDLLPLEIFVPNLVEQKLIISEVTETLKKTDSLQQEIDIQKKYIKLLRQNILQDAIEGKLTTAWRKSHPVIKGNPDYDAEALFEKIQKEKDSYKKQKELPPITDKEKTFEIPEGWKWVRLGELVIDITSGSREWAKYYSNHGALFLRMGNLSKDSFHLRLNNLQYVNVPDNSEGKRTRLQPGDLLFSITADIGNLGLIPENFEEAYINQHTARIRFMELERTKFLPYVLLSPLLKKQYLPNAHGMKNSFRLDTLSFLKLPLPPLAEQEEIVSKVESLLTKITELENQIQERKTLSEKLAFGIIKEKLEG